MRSQTTRGATRRSRRALILFAAADALPMLNLVAMSFHEVDWVDRGIELDWVGLAALRPRSPDDTLFRAGIGNTIIFAVVAVALQMVLGFALALMTTRITRGRVVYRTIFILPILVPGIVIGAIWKLMLNYDFGLINQALAPARDRRRRTGSATAHSRCSRSSSSTSGTGRRSASCCCSPARNRCRRTSTRRREIDGAGGWQELRYVTLPLMVPGDRRHLRLSADPRLQGVRRGLSADRRRPGHGDRGRSASPSTAASSPRTAIGYGSAMSIAMILRRLDAPRHGAVAPARPWSPPHDAARHPAGSPGSPCTARSLLAGVVVFGRSSGHRGRLQDPDRSPHGRSSSSRRCSATSRGAVLQDLGLPAQLPQLPRRRR